MKIKYLNKYFITMFIFLTAAIFPAGKGTIKGRLTDSETKLPLNGANIIILNSGQGAASDSSGNFLIENVSAGAYSLQISYIGYETKTITDVIVKPDRIIYMEEGLKPSAGYEIQAVESTAGYFSNKEIQPASITSFSYEEIRRAPGAAGDVSRILMSLPGIAKVNDQSNSLIVRGGSPSENAFFINNIEIPNINHYPQQGSTGGPIGMVNVDMVKDLNFFAGGFSPVYGDRLSSVMEINFREGSRDNFYGQANIDFSGFGGLIEGPVSDKGSYLISVRRSYLDLLIKAIDMGTSIAPRYSDYQWNIVYNLNSNNKLSFIGLIGDDLSRSDEKTAKDNQMEAYGEQRMTDMTYGVNLQSIWKSPGYSNTSLSFSSEEFNENYYKPEWGTIILDNDSHERAVRLRNVNHLNLGRAASAEFGIDAAYLSNRYNNFYGEYTDLLGNIVPSWKMNLNMDSYKTGLFCSFSTYLSEKFTATAGLRGDYFEYNKNITADPRISFSYRFNDLTSLNGAAGIFHQSLPFILLAQNNTNKDLDNPGAVHYVLGIDHLLTESTKLTFEIYDKEYSHFPLDPSQPSFFIIDENIYNNLFYSYHSVLNNSGKAFSRGAEITIQKKLAEDIYGLASASYSKSRYKAGDGVWRNRVFDNGFTFSLEGGYKPNNIWEFSARWIYAGGAPYTPFNTAASSAANTGILDESRVNEDRYPAYHSLNIRVDRNFNFNKSDIVVYISIWNAYSRQNVAHYYWNTFTNSKDTIYQWTLLPIFGVKYEF